MSDNATQETESSGGRRRLPWIIMGAALVAVLAGGWWFLGPAMADEVIPDEDGEIVQLEAMTTTVGEQGLHHARVGLAVVLTVVADPEVIEPREALLRDALLHEVSTMGASELRSSAGSAELRERLSAEARDVWGDDVVRRVVLTELLVQ